MTRELEWVSGATARRAVLLTGVAVAVAFWFDRPALLAVATVPVALLVLTRAGGRPAAAEVTITHPPRCFEQERVPVTITVRTDGAVGMIEGVLRPGPGMQIVGEPRAYSVDADHVSWTVDVAARRWGSRTVGCLEVQARDRSRLGTASLWIWPEQELRVYPSPPPMHRLAAVPVRVDRTGDHVAVSEGSGVEFASVRTFTSGDRPRAVNWPVSTRRGRLYVTTRSAERAVDVVLVVDVLVDAGPPGRSSCDLALRGCAGTAQAVLRAHDRAGLIAVGGRLQWLRPDLAERQFYRIADAILAAADAFSYLDPDVDRIPYSGLPAGARVICFSPLLDTRGVTAIHRLRARGHPVTVVDVCTSEPVPRTAADDLAVRLWRLDRLATRRRLSAEGIPVLAWDGTKALDPALAAVSRPSQRTAS